MNKIFSAAMIFSALSAGSALAQTTVAPPAPPIAATPSAPSAVTPSTPSTTTPTRPLAMTPSTPSAALPPTSSATAPPAVASSGANNTTAAPVAGANSFTHGQAQKRIEDQGYTQVTALAKDAQSIWRGNAMKDGKAVTVALDYQCNITAN